MVMADDLPTQQELEPREPTLEDLRELCRELNRRGARYVIVGGFAIRAAGYNRRKSQTKGQPAQRDHRHLHDPRNRKNCEPEPISTVTTFWSPSTTGGMATSVQFPP